MKLFVTIAITLMAGATFAQGSKPPPPPPPVSVDDFTCGKSTGITLGEFKVKLVESCDLNKPFTSSLSSMLNEVTYFYCCHKKK